MINASFWEWCHVHTEFLYTMIYERGFVFFDFWSLAHFWSGLVLFMILAALNFKHKWFWFIFFILLYEFCEVAFIYFALNIFKPERYNDLIMDVFVGVSGAIISNHFLLYKSNAKKVEYLPAWLLMLFSSLTLAFIWVGNYRYKYNYEILNTKGLNIGAFGLWMIGGFIFLLFYDAILRKENRVLRRLFLAWIVYFVLLLATEYTGYYLMQWHEVSVPGARPLILGLIHGNWALHLYYILFPLLIIPFYEVLMNLVFRAQNNLARQKYKINEQAIRA
jgi:hypothetical protein